MINFELTGTPALSHTHGVFLADDLGADLHPKPFRTHHSDCHCRDFFVWV
jgi:hypothetical protein